MAKLYQKYNQNTGKRLGALAGVLLCILLTAAAVLYAVCNPALWWLALLMGLLCLVCGIKCLHKAKSLHSGLRGEKQVSALLRQNLPANFCVVANPVLIINGQTVELDAVVLSANGVCLVETKNVAGALSGTKTDAFWTQTRLGKGGVPLTKQMKNPLLQNERQVRLVTQWLAPFGAIRVTGCVYFANSYVQVALADPRIFTGETALLRHLQTSKKPPLDAKTIKAVTRAFRRGKLHENIFCNNG
ncbi:MAG: nuclease-related domain-containing protein [Ruthenibacterium sp.]